MPRRATPYPGLLWGALAVLAQLVLALHATPVAAQQADRRCTATQLKAAGRLCKNHFRCYSAAVKRPERDPELTRLSSCLGRAGGRFESSWEKARFKASRKGDACSETSGSDALFDFEITAGSLIFDVLAGWTGLEKEDNKLRSSLLKEAGQLCSKDLAAESKNAKKPDEAKRSAGLAKARSRFEKKTGKALAKASSKGADYTGLPTELIADDTEDLAQAFVTIAAAAVSLGGTIFAAAEARVDSDVNDGVSPLTRNDSFATAQSVPVPVNVGGYVSLPGASATGPLSSAGDLFDVYRVSLAAGQEITLFIGDAANLDLRLYDATLTPPALVDASESMGTIESLTAPSDGEFFVEVLPASGCACASNYVLSIGQPLPGAAAMEARRSVRASHDFVPGELIVTLGNEASAPRRTTDRQTLAGSFGMQAAGGAPDRAMLWRLGPAANRSAALAGLGVESTAVQLRARGARVSDTLAARLDTIRAGRALERFAEVERCELNYRRQALRVPDDPNYSRQWHYPLVNLPQAWDLTTGSPSVTVAVIDTGVLLAHPDLDGQFLMDGPSVVGFDFISDPDNARDGDGIDPDPNDPGDLANVAASSFHGTHVSGTIAAASDNGVGVAGVAWDVRIMPLRVLGLFGGSTFDIIQAVLYAAQLPNDSETVPPVRADVINLSLGGSGSSSLEQAAFTAAREAGAIIVAAAGNGSSAQPSYPAAYDGVVSVAALDLGKNRAPYSNFGISIDVAAPGGDSSRDRDGDGFPDGVWSTLADDSAGGLVFNYQLSTGTSMAAPHVAGVAALMKSVNPDLTPSDFDTFLGNGDLTEDLGAPGRDDLFGSGAIDAFKAVVAAGGPPPIPNPTLVAIPSALNLGVALTNTTLTVTNGATGDLAITDFTADPEAWLTVSTASVDASGLGTYSVAVDRAGLEDGTYAAQITFTSDANAVNVPVVMSVGSAVDADAGVQFVLLVDPISFQTVGQADVVSAENGSYEYGFVNVPAGRYVIISGTDHDNDNVICDAGEACGSFPTLDLLQPVDFDTPRTDLDFVTGFQSAINATAEAADASRGVRLLRTAPSIPGAAAPGRPAR